MSDFVRVAKTTDLSDPGQMLLEVEDRIVVLFQVGGEFFCIDDVCTHDGGPLSEGTLDDHTIACPRHGAKFDIRTGKALTMPATVDTAAHEVKVEATKSWVRLSEPGELPPASPGSSSRPTSNAAAAATSTPKPWHPQSPTDDAIASNRRGSRCRGSHLAKTSSAKS